VPMNERMTTTIASPPRQASEETRPDRAASRGNGGSAPLPPPLPPRAVMPPPVPILIPYAARLVSNAAPPAFAQQAAVFSIATWLFIMTAAVVMHFREVRVPPAFALLLSFSLLAGLALGIIATACGGKPKRPGILIPGLIGISLNGMLLAMIVWSTLGVMARAQQSGTVAQQTVYVPQAPPVPYRPYSPPPAAPHFPHRFP
jgi:hypothetical protein